jgi:hypothetical protein
MRCLLVLVAFLFRSSTVDRDVKAKEQSLQRLDAESRSRNSSRTGLGIIAEVENAHLAAGPGFLPPPAEMGYAGIFAPSATGEELVLQVLVPAVAGNPEWLHNRLAGVRNSPRSDRDGENRIRAPRGGLPAQPALVFPLLPRGTPAGAMIFCLPAAELDRREKELHRIGKLYEALISYRLLQSEIAFRTEEANVVSLFLTEIATFAAIDKLFDAMFDYFRDTYSQTSVTILRVTAASRLKGALIEEDIVFQLVPEGPAGAGAGPADAAWVGSTGRSKIFAAVLPYEPKAILIVPPVTFHQIFVHRLRVPHAQPVPVRHAQHHHPPGGDRPFVLRK